MTKNIIDEVQDYLDNREPWEELRDELELAAILAEVKRDPGIPPNLDQKIKELIASNSQPQNQAASDAVPRIDSKQSKKQTAKSTTKTTKNIYEKSSIDKKTKRTRRNLKIVLALAAVFTIIPITASAFDWKKAVMQIVIKAQEKYSEIHFKTKEQGNYQEEFIPYAPTYIPEGLELTSAIYEPWVIIGYENVDYTSSFVYSQRRKKNYKSRINTEGVELEKLIFMGKEAYYYSNVGIQNLIWIDDDYAYDVSGTFDRETIFKIARSIQVYTGSREIIEQKT